MYRQTATSVHRHSSTCPFINATLGIRAFTVAGMTKSFTSILQQTDNISFRVNPGGHCFPTLSAAFLLCPLKSCSAGWFCICNVVRSSCVGFEVNSLITFTNQMLLQFIRQFWSVLTDKHQRYASSRRGCEALNQFSIF